MAWRKLMNFKLRLMGMACTAAVLLPMMHHSAFAQETDDSNQPVSTTAGSTPITDNEARLDTVVVTGRRSGLDSTIEEKRNAKQIVDVLSAGAAGRLPDNNVAEALSRISGITTLRNGDTGEGDFISIRGLDSALNNVQFNGINSGQANGGDRRVPLDGINADDIAEIRVAKSLLPSDEGEGIGGAINVISKTPLQRGKDEFRFSGAGRYNEFSGKTGYEFGAGFTKIFNDRFGVTLSGNTRRREIENIEMNANSSNPTRLPQLRDAAGNVLAVDDIIDNLGGAFDQPGDSYDNVQAGLFSANDVTFEDYLYELSNQTREAISVSGAADWQVTDSTRLTLGGFFSQQDTEATEYTFGFDLDEDEFVNINGVATTVFDDTEVDVRGAIEDEEDFNGNLYLKGTTELDRLELKYQVSYARATRDRPFYRLGFDTGSALPNDGDITTFFPWTYRDTYFGVPNAAALQIPSIAAAFSDFEGTQIGDEWSYEPIDSQENDRYAFKFDADYELGTSFVGGTITSVQVGAKLERSEVELSFLDITGGDIELLNLDGTYNEDGDGTAEDAFLGAFTGLYRGLDVQALENINSPLNSVGIRGIPTFNESALRGLIQSFGQSYAASGSTDIDAENFYDIQEDVASVYAQAEFEWDRLTVIAGVRVEDYQGTFVSPVDLGAELVFENDDDREIDLLASNDLEQVSVENDNTEVLPRLVATYKLNDQIQFRGGFGYSIARPTYRQLADETEIAFDLIPADGALVGVLTAADVVAAGITLADLDPDSELDISSGNAALENARSMNIDFSAEYYPSESTALSFGVFYKEIDNFIFIGQESGEGGEFAGIINDEVLASFSPEGRQIIDQLGGVAALTGSDFSFNVSQPQNGGTAEVYGVEIGLVHAFDWAPSIFSDMGFAGNVTFTESEATYAVAQLEEGQDYLVDAGFFEDGATLFRTTSFFAAPDVSANASLYYEANDLEVALSASYQSSAFDAKDDYGLDQYNDAYFQADFFIGYKLPIKSGDYSVFLEIPDITDNGVKATDAQSVGRDSKLFDEASFNGREVTFGIRAKF